MNCVHHCTIDFRYRYHVFFTITIWRWCHKWQSQWCSQQSKVEEINTEMSKQTPTVGNFGNKHLNQLQLIMDKTPGVPLGVA